MQDNSGPCNSRLIAPFLLSLSDVTCKTILVRVIPDSLGGFSTPKLPTANFSFTAGAREIGKISVLLFSATVLLFVHVFFFVCAFVFVPFLFCFCSLAFLLALPYLDASSHLYMTVCPSVRVSVRMSVSI